jgi:murein DD-endopeptidase MepM/ murein hydrolase activator NlpD
MTAGAVAHPSESAARDARHADRALPLSVGARIAKLIDRRQGFWRQYGLHVALAGVVSAVALVPGLSLPEARLVPSRDWAVAASFDQHSLDDREAARRGVAVAAPATDERFLERSALLRTSQAQYPQWQPQTYTVQDGDTLSTLAERFGLDQRTVVWANDALVQHPDQLSVGQQLVILPLNAAYHMVAEGDTLQSIAAKYQVPAETIIAYKGNAITDPNTLGVGSRLVVPGAALPDVPKPTPVPRVASDASNGNKGQTYTADADASQPGSGALAWPLDGMITQNYGGGHRGIDIYRPTGYAIYAADGGTVVLVSWLTYSYGYHIIIDHGNGLETLYAHMSEIEVEVGQVVTQGQEVGKVGTTGRVTGPHLHFEVLENGVHRNPFNYLP